MNDILIVLGTFPNFDKVRETGTALAESQLAACVNPLVGQLRMIM